jgi:hypothetical protein
MEIPLSKYLVLQTMNRLICLNCSWIHIEYKACNCKAFEPISLYHVSKVVKNYYKIMINDFTNMVKRNGFKSLAVACLVLNMNPTTVQAD